MRTIVFREGMAVDDNIGATSRTSIARLDTVLIRLLDQVELNPRNFAYLLCKQRLILLSGYILKFIYC